jgi:Tol biopolymer transport system component
VWLLRIGTAVFALALAVAGGAGAGARFVNGELLYLRPLGGNAPPYGRLFVMRADGSGVRDVTPAGILDAQQATWSPDGLRIAFAALAIGGGDSEIYVAAADGSGLRQLTDNYLPDRMPTWSPDGRRIAFAQRTHRPVPDLLDALGRKQATAPDRPGGGLRGTRLVAERSLDRRFVPARLLEVVLLRPDGSREHRLLPGYPRTEGSPSWTPDGRILFSRGAPRPAGRGIFSVRPRCVPSLDQWAAICAACLSMPRSICR